MQNRIHSFDIPNPDHDRPTQWPFASQELATEFEQLCRDALTKDGRDVRIVDGCAFVAGQPGKIGLHNLADICAQLPQATWPMTIAEHLALSEGTRVQSLVDNLTGGSFEQLAEFLVVRLYPPPSEGGFHQEDFVQREDLPGLHTVLAIELCGSMMSVPRPVADLWGVPDEELFARAMQNVAKFCEGQPCAMEMPRPVRSRFEFLEGGSYAAVGALRFDKLPFRVGRHGNLLGLPVRDSLISWPIDEWPSDELLGAMFAMAQGRNQDGPYPVSRHLYWRKPDGTFEAQRGMGQGARVRLAASIGFAQLRSRLFRQRRDAR